MSILTRVKNMINASLNDLLDKVEDPERALNQMIRDMEQAILEMRRETAGAITSRKMAERKLEKIESEKEKWARNAEMAVEKNDDDLALKALERKAASEQSAETARRQLEEAADLVEQLKEELNRVVEKVQEARSKRDTLITKKRAAAATKRLMTHSDRFNQTAPGVYASAEKIINGFDSFERFEESVDRSAAEVEANRELRGHAAGLNLDETFEDMRRRDAFAEELEQLKKRKGVK